MSSIAEAQKVLVLERKIAELESRIEVLERLGSFVDEAEPIRRGPGRPKKLPQPAPEA